MAASVRFFLSHFSRPLSQSIRFLFLSLSLRMGGREGGREGGSEGGLGVVVRRHQNVAQGIQLVRRKAKLVAVLPFVLVCALEVCEGLADGDLTEGGKEGGKEGRKEGEICQEITICTQESRGREGGRKGGREVRPPVLIKPTCIEGVAPPPRPPPSHERASTARARGRKGGTS